MKKILYTILLILGMVPLVSLAAPEVRYDKTIVPDADSLYDLGTSTNAWRNLYVDQVCLTGDTCETTWPTGGVGGSSLHIDGGTFVYPHQGNTHSAPSYNATSTTATSTFAGNMLVGTTTGNHTLSLDGKVGVYGTQSFFVPFQFQTATSADTQINPTYRGNRNWSMYIGDGGQFSTTTTATLNPVDDLSFESNGSYNGALNLFVGMGAGYNNVSGNFNTFLGPRAGESNINGTQNTFVGGAAGFYNTSGYHNTCIGIGACQDNQTGYYNTRVGTDNGLRAVNGNENVSIGASADSNSLGSQNISIGVNARTDAYRYGSQNVAIGTYSLGSDLTGETNTAVGHASLVYNRSATNTVAVGTWAGGGVSGVTSSGYNTFLGYYAGTKNTTGGYNTLLGYKTGYFLSSGSGNTAIGSNVDFVSTTTSGQLNIGNLIWGNNLYSGTTVSSSTVTNGVIGIGTSSPGIVNGQAFSSVQFHVAGTGKYSAFDTSGNGGILINDASEVANGRLWSLNTNISGGQLGVATLNDAGSTWQHTTFGRNGNLGVGTTSPYARLSVAGEAVAERFTATSTTATSTFAGGITVDTDSLIVDHSTGRVGAGTTSPSFKFETGGTFSGETAGALAGLGAAYFGGTLAVNSIRDNVSFVTIAPQVTNNVGGDEFTSFRALNIIPSLRTSAAGANGYGIYVNPSVGATNNYSAYFADNVGIATTSPYAKLSVVGQVVGDNFTATAAAATSTFLNTSVNGTLVATVYRSFTYATTTWSGTTTVQLGPSYGGETWTGIQCYTDTGTVNVSVSDGTNALNMFTASTTVGTITYTTNNTFKTAEKRQVSIGTPASSPTTLACTAAVKQNTY